MNTNIALDACLNGIRFDRRVAKVSLDLPSSSHLHYLFPYTACTCINPIYSLEMDNRPSLSDDAQNGRPASVPPLLAGAARSSPINPFQKSTAVLLSQRQPSEPTLPLAEKDRTVAVPLDLMPQLQRSGPSIVKTRTGSVLSRGFILKTDHYPSGAPLEHCIIW